MSSQGHKRQVRRLLDAPKIISRPLMLIDGHGYAARWEYNVITENGQVTNARSLSIIRSDRTRFYDGAGIASLSLSELEMQISLPEIPDDTRLWFARGRDAYANGYQPNAKDVFQHISDVVNCFIDFSKSLASQETMRSLVACYIIATYFLDAFDVIGYLCANGEKGSGNTRLINVIAEVSFMHLCRVERP